MRRLNNLHGLKKYIAWAVIGLVVGFMLAVVDHQIEPDQPLYVLVIIGFIAGLTQAFVSERARRRQRS